MRLGRRDRDYYARPISPGARVATFLFAIVAVGVLSFVGWKYVKGMLSDASHDLPPALVAGDTFDAGQSEVVFGTETEAVLDGVEQKIQAEDPTDEWLENVADAVCDKSDVCTAPAFPTDVAQAAGEASGFLGTGWSLPTLVGLLILVWFAYVVITEEGS